MALTKATLARVSNSAPSLPALWVYSTSDTIAALQVANYWAMGPQVLTAGDIIFAKCGNGTAEFSVTSASTTASVVEQTMSVWVQATVTGLGTPGTVGWALAPIAGTIVGMRFLTTTAIDGDNTINLEVGGTNCTGSMVVPASGSAAGVVFPAADSVATPITAGGTVTAGQAIKVESDGGGTVGAGVVFIHIQS